MSIERCVVSLYCCNGATIKKQHKMKTTIKEFNKKVQERKDLKSLRQAAKEMNDFSMVHACDVTLNLLEEEYFSQLETKCVKFWIGSRCYYRELITIGKAFFNHGEKMTKSRGYHGITVIHEITEKMQNEMIADSYYY